MHLYEDYADFNACDLTFKNHDNYNLYYNGNSLIHINEILDTVYRVSQGQKALI